MRTTMWLKSCPKCKGDQVLEQDRWGRFKTCIQCGHTEELRVEQRPEPVLIHATGARRAA